MKYALVGNIKCEAEKGLKGFCPYCGSELISKCGTLKLKHWSHKAIRHCDLWWEPETDWHRFWKNKFSSDWQETILIDENTGEKHIADIKTNNGLVIEFQHSYISSDERISREKFYKNMLWVVDGTRVSRDFKRFAKRQKEFLKKEGIAKYLVLFPDETFPKQWLNSSAPVVFDFLGLNEIDDENDSRIPLYVLYPNSNDFDSTIEVISRELFFNRIVFDVKFINEDKSVDLQYKYSKDLHNLDRREAQYIIDRNRIFRRKRF